MNDIRKRCFFFYEPGNEMEVCILFGLLLPYLEKEWVLDEFYGSYPDCTFMVDGRRTRVEFEHYSGNFVPHGHDPEDCDIIVCWKHNWPDCPLPVVELSKFIDTHGLQDLIKNSRPKWPVTQWTVAEFLAHIEEHSGKEDRDLVKTFVQHLDKDDQIHYMPGRGKREVTLKIYAKRLSHKDPLFGIHSTPEGLWAWIDYKPFEPTREEVVRRLRDFFVEPSKQWHKLRVSGTPELIESLQNALSIVKG
jgi:hypothetical protein